MDTKKFSESQFLSVAEVKASPSKKLVILSQGSEILDDQKNPRFQCLVEMDGRQRLYRPNKPTLKNIQNVWGTDSEGWVGKSLSLSFAILQGGRDAIIGIPNP